MCAHLCIELPSTPVKDNASSERPAKDMPKEKVYNISIKTQTANPIPYPRLLSDETLRKDLYDKDEDDFTASSSLQRSS